MNRLEEQQIRQWVRKILVAKLDNSNELLVEYTGGSAVGPRSSTNFGKTFYDPFANILRASKVGLEQIVNATGYNLKVLFTIRPSKMAEYRENYKARADKLASEMKAVTDAARAAAGPDMEFVTFLMNPQRYIVTKASQKVWDETFGRYSASFGGLKDDPRPPAQLPGAKDLLTGLVSDLNKLFFFGHHAPAGQVISEQEGAESGAQDELAKYLEKGAKKMIALKQKQIDDVQEMLKPQLDLIQGLIEAKDAVAFGAALEKAGQEDIDIGIDTAKLEADIEAGAEKILGNEESREMLIDIYRPKEKEEDVPSEDAPPIQDTSSLTEQDESEWAPSEEQLRADAETMVLKGALKEGGLVDALFEAEAALKNEALELIDEPGIGDDEVAIMKETKLGQTYLAVLDRAVEEIKTT